MERRRIKCNVGEKQRLRKMNSLATYLFLSDHPQSPRNNKMEKGKGNGSNPGVREVEVREGVEGEGGGAGSDEG